MKKITLMMFFFVCAIGFSQEPIKMMGTNSPVVFEQQRTDVNPVITISENAAPSMDISALGINNPTYLAACTEENPNDGTFENGFNCSSASAFQTANDVTVAADENFTLENITASIFANGGISNVDVNYYDDAAGLPGSLIGSEASVTIDNQTVIGSNFGFDVNEVEMTVTPFTFNGQAGMPTTYWIELSVTDGGATGSVFWVVTSSTAVGNPTAQFNAGWGIPDPLMDGVYIWSGTCDSLGVSDNALAGFSYYPNPATEVLSLRSANNIESVSMYNLLGQQVISTEIGATTSDINLSSLTAGTYIMKVTVDGQTGTYKVLKN